LDDAAILAQFNAEKGAFNLDDTDGDGSQDGQEVFWGSNPTSATSKPTIAPLIALDASTNALGALNFGSHRQSAEWRNYVWLDGVAWHTLFSRSCHQSLVADCLVNHRQ